MKYKHEVFINFRGTDVRHGLLSHLTKDLRREKIDFYVDDAKLEVGDKISSLFTAIEESQILLVIFSKEYASSKWCLMELEKILECAEKNNQIAVVPVFYKLDPADVRYQRGDYGAALVEHETRETEVKVQNWKSALTNAADLSGFHYPLETEMDESSLVDNIVEHISRKLRKLYSSESNEPSKSIGLVGIDKNIGWVNSLIRNNDSKEIIKIGIWGMGGIGKTTIARHVYDKFSHLYEGCYFLENTRDELKKNNLSYLRDKVVFELLGEGNSHTTCASNADPFTMERLSRKKVLIVVDNVNTPILLKDFLEPIRFGAGSRVIVTSRNKDVFTSGVGFCEIHHVKELNSDESLELFCLNAFNESQPKRGLEELSAKAAAFARGIPLALKVFGSYFHSKREDIWDSALDRLNKYPDTNGEIQSVLRFSYDELVDTEKNIFLDIAFFFKGDDKDYVISHLDAWKFHGTSGIASLEEKALIAISKDNKIQMHDLLQKMGWQIVSEEPSTPGSRVNDLREVRDIFNRDKGSDSVEGILLDLSQIGEVDLSVDNDILKRMPKLRLIKVYSPLPIEVPMQIRYFIPEDFQNVERETLEESERLNQSCEDIHEVPKGAELEKFLNTIIEEHILRMPKFNLLMHVNDEYPMPNWRIMQDMVNNTNGSIMSDISNHLVMLPKLSKLEGVQRLVNYTESDGVLVLATHDLSRSMPQPNLNIGSALKELMNLGGGEIHVKSIHRIFMEEGCSVSKDLSFSRKEIRSINNSILSRMEASFYKHLECSSDAKVLQHDESVLSLRDTRMELLNSSIGCFISHDCCSDIDDLQLESKLKDESPFVSFTHYYRLSNCREKNENSRKPKFLVLFDGLRYSEQMCALVLDGLNFKWSYLRNRWWIWLFKESLLKMCRGVEAALDILSIEETLIITQRKMQRPTFITSLIKKLTPWKMTLIEDKETSLRFCKRRRIDLMRFKESILIILKYCRENDVRVDKLQNKLLANLFQLSIMELRVQLTETKAGFLSFMSPKADNLIEKRLLAFRRADDIIKEMEEACFLMRKAGFLITY